jgi:hypothetical protein
VVGRAGVRIVDWYWREVWGSVVGNGGGGSFNDDFGGWALDFGGKAAGKVGLVSVGYFGGFWSCGGGQWLSSEIPPEPRNFRKRVGVWVSFRG